MKRLHIIKYLAPALLGLTCGLACAVPSEFMSHAKNLKVVVLVGHEVELARVGPMVFWNKRSVVPAKDTSLTDAVFLEIKAELDLEQQLTVERIDIKSEDLPRLAKLASEGANAFFGPSLDPIRAELTEYRNGCKCDALLVVATSHGQINSDSTQTFNGFAWVGMTGFNEDVRRSFSVAYVTLFLIDPVSGETVTNRGGGTEGGFAAIAADHWPNKMTTLSDYQWYKLTQSLATSFGRNIRKPLYKLGLRPSCGMYFWEIDHPEGGRTFNFHDQLTQEGPPVLSAGADPAKCKK